MNQWLAPVVAEPKIILCIVVGFVASLLLVVFLIYRISRFTKSRRWAEVSASSLRAALCPAIQLPVSG